MKHVLKYLCTTSDLFPKYQHDNDMCFGLLRKYVEGIISEVFRKNVVEYNVGCVDIYQNPGRGLQASSFINLVII